MKKILTYLFEGNKLSAAEATEIMLKIGKGIYSEAEFASFLTVFLMRPITAEELNGFREAMFQLSLKTDLSEFETIDVVGTGGDGKDTFNISTLASFILAGAGLKVAKHGNYASSSKSGSSNVLEHFGYQFSSNSDKLKKEIENAGICFLHAPLFHPAMKFIAPVRRAMKVKTFFNILGPMINPSAPKYQLLGVYNQEVFELYKNVYKNLPVKYSIINNVDGYDEISLTDNARVATNNSDKIIKPTDFGFSKIAGEDLFSGESVKEAAVIFKQILTGNGTEAQNNVVIANAALGLQCVFPEKNLEECVSIAKESLESKKALHAFKKLIP